MDVNDFVRKIPKVELHNHIIGAMRLETALDLAKKNGVPTPPGDPQNLYEYDNLIDFLTAHVFVSTARTSHESPTSASRTHTAPETSATPNCSSIRQTTWTKASRTRF